MIRPAHLSDVERIVEMGRVLHAESAYRKISYSPEKVEMLITRLINGDGVVFVAECEGAVVGGIAGGVTDHWFSDELQGFDYSFFVMPEARQGLHATKLMLALKSWCKAKGATVMRMGITTGINVEGTARFYKYLGLEEMGPLFSGEL